MLQVNMSLILKILLAMKFQQNPAGCIDIIKSMLMSSDPLLDNCKED